MILSKKKDLDFSYLINFFISLLPISFIAGNLVINLNVILIILFSFLIYGGEIFEKNFFFFEKLLISIFVFAFFTAAINAYEYKNDASSTLDTFTLKKTFLFFRFLLLYFVIKFLIDKEIFNFKFFFFSASVCCVFVSMDIIYQLINGKDIFGYSKISFKLTGPFGDEPIAGSYLQRFSIFTFF